MSDTEESGQQLVVVYRCDFCQTESFPTMEEALEHEKICAAAPSNQSNQDQQPQPPREIATAPPEKVGDKYFRCQNCKILFTDLAQCRTHEESCTDAAWFSCRICNLMRFSNAGLLIEHERICNGAAHLDPTGLPLAEKILKGDGKATDDSSVEMIEPTSAVPNPLSPPTEEAKKDDSSVEMITHAVPNPTRQPQTEEAKKDDSSVEVVIEPPNNNADASSAPPAQDSNYITCWTCDVCNVAHFKTYEEAEEHENQCRIEMERKAKMKEQKPPKQASKGVDGGDSRQQTKNVVLFSPFVQSVSDSADFERISNCHAAILQSVKLLHHPFNGSVALQCQHCNEGMSTTWTFKKMTEMLPVQVCNHILECPHAPAEVVESMQQHISNILNKSSEIVGELPFEKFLESFLLSNGIVEGVIKGNTQLVLLPDDKFKKIKGYGTSKRGRLASPSTALIGTKKGKRQESSSTENSPSAKRPRQKTTNGDIHVGDMNCQLHYDDGRSMYVGPLDGIPFLTSLLQKEARYLHPSQKILLAQLELFELANGSLGFRCQNCITEKNGCCYMKLTSINKLARDILLFGEEHVTLCITKPKVSKQIQEALVGGDGELSKYCKLIADLYCMEDATVDGKAQVVFGECPEIPSGYTRPCDINFRAVLREFETNRINTNTDDLPKVPLKAPAQDEIKAPAQDEVKVPEETLADMLEAEPAIASAM